MNAKYNEVYHNCCNCHRELLNKKETKVPNILNVQAIVMLIIAISQLLYGHIRNISNFHLSHVPTSSPPIFPPLSSARTVPSMESCPTLVFSALVSRTKEDLTALATLWLRWLEVRVLVRARSVGDVMKIVLKNLMSQNFWKNLASKNLGI